MQLSIDRADLAPVVRAVLAELLDQLGGADRIAFPEREAAALLGVNQCVLKAARLAGEIQGAKVGKSFCYTRADLIAFVERRRARPGREGA